MPRINCKVLPDYLIAGYTISTSYRLDLQAYLSDVQGKCGEMADLRWGKGGPEVG